MTSRTKLILRLAKDRSSEQNELDSNKENIPQTVEHFGNTVTVKRTCEWVKNNFNSIGESVSSLENKVTENGYSSSTIISETTIDSMTDDSSSCSTVKLFERALRYKYTDNRGKFYDNNMPGSVEIPVEKAIEYSTSNYLNNLSDVINTSSQLLELKGQINDEHLEIQTELNATTNSTQECQKALTNDCDSSYTTADDEDRDKDFNISDYSSSSDNESTNEDFENEIYEPRNNGIQTLNEVITQFDENEANIRNIEKQLRIKNTNMCITNYDRKQAKINSTKKETRCKFCNNDMISKNFVRHLQTFHSEENEVKRILELPKKSKERRQGFSLLRRDTNFELFLSGEIRPFRKQQESEPKSLLYPCIYCKGLFKKNYLKRHAVQCPKKGVRSKNYVSDSQTLTACAIDPTNVISKLNVREQVFTIMKGDEIAFEAKKDLLIVHFGESYLKQHKRERKEYACSNRMRELSRFLIAFREITQNKNISLKEILVPKYFDNMLSAARHISGYDPVTKVFSAPSLAMHLGTYLKVVCDELNHLIIKETPGFICQSKEEMKNWQHDVKNVKKLITSRWNTEISSLANKDMQEKRWNKPLLIPLVNDIKIFRDGVLKLATECEKKFCDKEDDIETYKLLVNCTLSLLILFNRRRIGDVQYLKIKDYTKTIPSNFTDFEHALTDSEKALTQKYKRVVNSGKGSRAVVILVPDMLQTFIDTLLQSRNKYISENNKYVFALPRSKIQWGQGDVAIRNLAKKFNLQRPDAITSNKLRKHIATVTQILSLTKEESKQFSKFMGHTEKTHAEFYELPADIYQTAKVSKLLLMMEKGKLPIEYKGKSLDEIEIDCEFPYVNDDHNGSFKNIAPKQFSSTATDLVNVKDSGTVVESPMVFEEIECDYDVTKCNKRRKVQKRGWTQKEVDLLKITFDNNIKNGLYPTSKAVQDFVLKNGINRSVAVVKAKIQHLIALKKKTKL